MSAYPRTQSTLGVAKLFIASHTLSQCSRVPGSQAAEQLEDLARFLYISHTRLDHNDGIHPKVYQLNFSDYEYLLLGVDLAEKSFDNERIINHLDSIFSIGSRQTLWSVGNHDRVSNVEFQKYTNRAKYGIFQVGDLSFIVLDSQDSLNLIVGQQKDFLLNVLNTLSSRKLIFMSHKLIFMDQHPFMDELINKICNGKKGDCYYCHNTNNFQKEIYPVLQNGRKNGKEILWIGGDLGSKVSKFEFVDDDGIVFLGNGMDMDSNKNYVLEIENKDSLKYSFVNIDSLILRQNSAN